MKGSPSLLLAAMLSLPVTGASRRTGPVQYRKLLRCRLDRHHRDNRDHQRRTQRPRLQDQDHHDFRACDLQVAGRRQEHGRVPGQLDADHGKRHQGLPRCRHRGRRARTNLKGAKYTLAVPQALVRQGLHDFADIAKFKKELDGKIYGIEPGNDGNRLIQSMIDKNAFGLKDAGFKVVESSEAGMLSQVDRAQKRDTAVVFLGWAPHPMNNASRFIPAGGDDFFGPDFGAATVATNTRKGYASGMQQRRSSC